MTNKLQLYEWDISSIFSIKKKDSNQSNFSVLHIYRFNQFNEIV